MHQRLFWAKQLLCPGPRKVSGPAALLLLKSFFQQAVLVGLLLLPLQEQLVEA